MAKRKKVITHLVCEENGMRNYTQVVSKTRKAGTLKLKKYCPKCRRHTMHKESK